MAQSWPAPLPARSLQSRPVPPSLVGGFGGQALRVATYNIGAGEPTSFAASGYWPFVAKLRDEMRSLAKVAKGRMVLDACELPSCFIRELSEPSTLLTAVWAVYDIEGATTRTAPMMVAQHRAH